MKTCYVDEHWSIADLVAPGELFPDWTITRINVVEVHRGKGYGSDLLKRICDDADAEGVKLYLQVSPSGGLNFDQLGEWYGRYGFQESKRWPGGDIMFRPAGQRTKVPFRSIN